MKCKKNYCNTNKKKCNKRGNKHCKVMKNYCKIKCTKKCFDKETQPLRNYNIGSSTTAIADKLVSRPSTTPIKVQLFEDIQFPSNDVDQDGNYDVKYNAPSSDVKSKCFKKVVLTLDFSVEPGKQFDREYSLWKDGVLLARGTTAQTDFIQNNDNEWTVECNVTDYLKPLLKDGCIRMNLFNLIQDDLTSSITVSSCLEFYPLPNCEKCLKVPDKVIPLSLDEKGELFQITPTTTFKKVFQKSKLPTNIVRAELDLTVRGNGEEEFWFFMDFNLLKSTFYRELEVLLDGDIVSVIPIPPYIYTGGAAPALWVPIPNVETLKFTFTTVPINFVLGRLNQNKVHTFCIRIAGILDSGFNVGGNLKLCLDEKKKVVCGKVLKNTLSDKNEPKISNAVVSQLFGKPFNSQSKRSYNQKGYIDTSKGKIYFEVCGKVLFDETGTISNEGNVTTLGSDLSSSLNIVEKISNKCGLIKKVYTNYSYESKIDRVIEQLSSGNFNVEFSSDNTFKVSNKVKKCDKVVFEQQICNNTQNNLDYVQSSSGVVSWENQSSSQRYQSHVKQTKKCGTKETDFDLTLTAKDNLLESVTYN